MTEKHKRSPDDYYIDELIEHYDDPDEDFDWIDHLHCYIKPWLCISSWEDFMNYPIDRLHRTMTWLNKEANKKGGIMGYRQLENMLAVARCLGGSDKSTSEDPANSVEFEV